MLKFFISQNLKHFGKKISYILATTCTASSTLIFCALRLCQNYITCNIVKKYFKNKCSSDRTSNVEVFYNQIPFL